MILNKACYSWMEEVTAVRVVAVEVGRLYF